MLTRSKARQMRVAPVAKKSTPVKPTGSKKASKKGLACFRCSSIAALFSFIVMRKANNPSQTLSYQDSLIPKLANPRSLATYGKSESS